jgi:arylsulfatase A-like enzyme
MHFIGPDQLHGYEERLTTDIYPADFSWTPDWLKGPAYRPTGVSMRPVLEAGPCVRSLQIDYDDEVEYRGTQKLYDLARSGGEQPFFLTVSYTHPHPPFVAPQRHWDLYRDADIPPPRVAPIPYDELDEHSRWLHVAHAQDLYSVSPAQVQRARRAYYGMVSYVDEKIGRVLDVLHETGLADDTVVVFAGDHGEMLGERGMWFKQCFFEDSARVPLVVSAPGRFAPRRVAAPVSLVDLLPTLMDLATDGRPPDWVAPIDGHSLLPLVTGADDGRRPLRGRRVQFGRRLRRLTHGAPGALEVHLHARPAADAVRPAGRPRRAREPGRPARLRGRRTAPARPAGAGLGPARGARAHPGQPAPAAVPGRRGGAGAGAAELGLPAFRRRVATLHPRRRGRGADQREGEGALSVCRTGATRPARQ